MSETVREEEPCRLLRTFPFKSPVPPATRALARCRSALAEWGLTMPPGSPLVLDFGLCRFAEIGEIEFWVANEEAYGYCGKFLFVDEGQTCPLHHHRQKHETFFVVKGSVRMVLSSAEGAGQGTSPAAMGHDTGEHELVLHEGEVLAMAPGRRHAFSGLGGPALLLEVSMPSIRQDNFFAQRTIGDAGVI